MPDASPAASALDGIRERWSKVAYVGLKPEVVPEPGHQAPWLPDVDHLVKAVEAALKLTEPGSEVHRDLDGNEEGGVVRVVRCDVLREAITAALAGKEAGDEGT